MELAILRNAILASIAALLLITFFSISVIVSSNSITFKSGAMPNSDARGQPNRGDTKPHLETEAVLSVSNLDASRPPFAPDSTCPKVFVFSTAYAAGLGHRMTSLAIAISLALNSNAAVAIDSESMIESERYDAVLAAFTGGFPFISDMFGLHVSLVFNISSLNALSTSTSSCGLCISCTPRACITNLQQPLPFSAFYFTLAF